MPGPFGPGGGPNYTAKGIAAMLGLVVAATTGYFFAVSGGATGGLLFTEGTAAGTPAAGEQVVYAKSGGMYVKNSSGTETQLDASGISGLTTGRIPKAASSTTISDGSLVDDGAGSLSMPATADGSNGAELSFGGATAGAATAAHGKTSGNISLQTEAGGDGNGTDKNGGMAGSISFTGESGGAATGTGTGGAGTDITVAAGTGGAAAGVGGTSGAGGRINYTAGAPGAANGGTAGAYGWHAFTGNAIITGQNDAVQLSVKGHSTQTANLISVKNSADALLCSINSAGSINSGATVSGATLTVASAFVANSANVRLASGQYFGISSAADNSAISDTTMARVAAGVWCVGSGTTTTNGWLLSSSETSRVASDVTNATATMAAITGLTATVTNGRFYTGELVIKCNNSTAAEGISIDFDSSGATVSHFAAGASVLTGGTTVAVTTVSSALATDLNWTTITGETWITVKFSFVASSTGVFAPRFCEGAAHVTGTATVSKGSYMWIKDTP